MMRALKGNKTASRKSGDSRLTVCAVVVIIFGTLLILRLFAVQVLGYERYNSLASNEHSFTENLAPIRGEILAQDKAGGKPVPLATNRRMFIVSVNPKKVTHPEIAFPLSVVLGLREEEIAQKLQHKDKVYEVLARHSTEQVIQKLKELQLPLEGIEFAETLERYYPEGTVGGKIIGFVGENENGVSGRYGIEESFDEMLKGVGGKIKAEHDNLGRQIFVVGQKVESVPEKGADVLLSIDRSIEYFACSSLDEAVKQHGAEGGSVVIIEPETGKILAMCDNPQFDLNEYEKVKDLSLLNNDAIFADYEPGSIFKAITMASALDTDKITPDTTYEDKGYVKIYPYTLTNADHKVYHTQSMIGVLENSINTGAVFAMEAAGKEPFKTYVERFGFGEKTGIELPGEASGDISSLSKKGDIYYATASYGQGITVTPLQMVMAYGAIANGGNLMKPYLVDKLLMPDGSVIESKPTVLRRVISEKTSVMLKGMLAAVVKEGHGKKAAVAGYIVGGKTGTAQVPRKDGRGYDSGQTIGSFVGFAPFDNPRFAMIVRINNPKDVIWAESTAGPLFGKIAKFLLEYLEVPPESK